MAVLHVTKETFEAEVLNSNVPVLVDFWATWCGPCKMLAPVIDEVAEELSDVKVCKVDVDQQQEIAIKYGIMTIPTLIVFKNGEIVKKSSGFIPKEEVLALLK